ncbi:MAG: AAC(3) family N-acetyltransferase [Anaerolineae bacterium]|nr:AAC(3) family N-acetyltransferase [Anaerolineae bacterium]
MKPTGTLTTIQRIADDLRAIGVRSGGVLLVHSSLSAMGYVAGGPETVIQGLLRAVGSKGTLLLPALSYEHVTVRSPLFDVQRTPSNVGAISEYFRTRPGTRRSVHPTHSVCGVGRLTAELLQNHHLDATPCGPYSPFHLLPKFRGQIMMLGCGLRPNTSMHAIEELIEPSYLLTPPIIYTLIQNGQRITKRYRPHNFLGWRQRYDRIEGLLDGSGLKRGSVLSADVFIIEASVLWEVALAALRQDPLYFVEPMRGR